MFDMTSHFQSKSMQVLHHLLIVMMYLYSSWSVAQGINLWGEHESTDMDSTWGQGPQMTFSNPAGLIQHQGLGLSYDLKLYMNDFMTDPHKVIQVHQGALSAGIGKYYQTSQTSIQI